MKTKILFLLLLARVALCQSNITYTTTYPTVQLTAPLPGILAANGQALNLWFAPADFITSASTVRLNPNSPYFIPAATNTSTFVFTNPITAPGITIMKTGTLWTSNTWNLTTITNGMQNGDVITVNSNGQRLVDVWMSNAVPILKPHW